METNTPNRPTQDEALLRGAALELEADLLQGHVNATRKAARRYFALGASSSKGTGTVKRRGAASKLGGASVAAERAPRYPSAK